MRKKWAFLVGISDYDHRGFNRLSFANEHISDFEDLLRSSGDFEEKSIITLKSDDPPDKRPNRTHIINQFDKLLKKIDHKNTLFIYFVCHGGFFGDKNYIFPLNANKDDDDILIDTSLSIEWFTRRIKKYDSKSWKVYFFIDACREQLTKSSFGKKLEVGILDDKVNITTFKNLDKNHLPLGINFFFACCEGEKSWHFKKENRMQSIFSYALIKGLREKINKPPIYLGELITSVKDEVENIVSDGTFPIQRPHDPIPDGERDVILLGHRYEDELMARLFNPEFQEKLHLILNEYDNSIEKLIAINVLDRNGKLVWSKTRISEESVKKRIDTIIKSIVRPIIKTSKKQSFFSETILAESYRIINRVVEPELIFLTVCYAMTKIDPILENASIAGKYITQAFNGLSIAPKFPKAASEFDDAPVERVIQEREGELYTGKKSEGKTIFISYSFLDTDYFQISKIVRRLELYPKIKEVIFWEVDSKQNIIEFMEGALRKSDTFVLFCSKNSSKSEAVKGEWQSSYQMLKKNLIKLIPVYENEDDIPRLLWSMLNVRYTKDDFDGFIQKLYEEILR